MGQLRLLHPIPMSQFSPGGRAGAPPPLYIISGCLCPVASSPPCCSFMPNGPCLEHRPQLVCQGPQQQTLESLFLSLPLNFNSVVTECPCVPATEDVSGSAVPETWPTWSSEEQGNQSSGTSIGSQPLSPHLGQGDCQGHQLWSSCCPYLYPCPINLKGKPLPSISPRPLWEVCWPGRGQHLRLGLAPQGPQLSWWLWN